MRRDPEPVLFFGGRYGGRAGKSVRGWVRWWHEEARVESVVCEGGERGLNMVVVKCVLCVGRVRNTCDCGHGTDVVVSGDMCCCVKKTAHALFIQTRLCAGIKLF